MMMLSWGSSFFDAPAFHPHDPLTSPLRLSTEHFQANWQVPLVTSVGYVAFIAYGHTFMKERPAFHLQRQLVAWNFFLALFSFVGATKTAPLLWTTLMQSSGDGFHTTLCGSAADGYGKGSSGLWVQLFVVSKFFELLDTVFIVLRKRKLLFLHWYHHFTVLLYCYHSYAVEAPHALYFVAMNYSVHAVMYFYYGLMALHAKPKWLPPELITTAQISQMVVGVAVQIAAMSKNCGDTTNLVFGALMYASYLGLFLKFAVERYVLRKFPRGKLFKVVGGYDKPASIRSAFPVFFRLVDAIDFYIGQKQKPLRRSSSSAISIGSSTDGDP
mmetsp:Transcript_32777/g.104491  ORF Transcript_32777/g.104491 Transcript_32777/m.104491 type:complete len:328 (+) Transcript_32777:33-1016(+)